MDVFLRNVYADDVANYRSIIRHVGPALRRGNSRVVHPVALIFGSPACKVMKEDVLPSLKFFNFRSGSALDMFCVGYKVTDLSFATGDFDDKAFHLAIMEFEERSKWKYSGETDLLCLNAFLHEESGRKHVDLDFGTVFKLTLENAVQDKLIQSARQFLEDLMRYAREHPGEDVPANISDNLFLKTAGRGFIRWVLSLLKLPSQDAENIFRTCVHDYSRPTA